MKLIETLFGLPRQTFDNLLCSLRRLIGLNLLIRLQQNVSAIQIDTSYLRATFKMVSVKVRYD